MEVSPPKKRGVTNGEELLRRALIMQFQPLLAREPSIKVAAAARSVRTGFDPTGRRLVFNRVFLPSFLPFARRNRGQEITLGKGGLKPAGPKSSHRL